MPLTPDGAVVVVGLGAMGGSVAKACAARWPSMRVQGIDPSAENARLAARDGVEVVGGLGQCRLDGSAVVYAAPLDVTVSLVEAEAEHWSRAAVATDVASLKAPVLEAAGRAGDGVGAGDRVGAFVGAHPMCGSEAGGYGAARADLFEGATIWLCPGPSSADALPRAESFWRALGGRPRVADPERHDRLMSRASHLPQLVSWALGGVLAEEGVTRADLGPGGRDMTRLAASSPEMWLPLLEAAAADDAQALRQLERAVVGLRRAIEHKDSAALGKMIREARRWAAGHGETPRS